MPLSAESRVMLNGSLAFISALCDMWFCIGLDVLAASWAILHFSH